MHIQKIVFFIVCSFFSRASYCQISATSGPVSACAPANITFSAPAGASNISWTFGSFPPSTAASGGFSALNPGTFTATFSGLVNGNPVTFSVPVTVNPKPTANFSIQQPNNSCAIKTVTLVNQSTGASPIVNWLWVYGDGGLGTFTTGANHTYGYAAVGSFSITLQITDVNGCDDQISKGTVNVISSPTAVISSNPPLLVGCLSNFSAAFSASNSLGASLSYNWSFGNGQTAASQNVGPLTFTSQTIPYAVSLTVTSSGCSHVATTYVTVSPATLSVSLPPTVCVNALATATVTSNQPYTLWNMGNSNIFALSMPTPGASTVNVPPYAAPGIYTVVINAGSSPCTAAPVTRTVLVEQVTTNFVGSTPTVSCGSPFLVTYSNTSSSNATQFQWFYEAENSVTATATGSVATFTLSHGSLNQYAIYNRAFTPTITLTAISPAGCMSAITKTVHSIERPSAWFNTDKKEGCVPLTVSFRDSSILFSSCPIISYTWCNGASPPAFVTGTLPLPPATNTRIPWQTFVYNVTGTYTPYLIIETASNYTNTTITCTDISFLDRIIVADPPVLSFSVPPGPFCHTDTVQIVNTSPTMNDVQHWHVDSDNGFFSGCISDPNPKWKFTNAGTFNFTLTGYQNSCANTAFAGPVTIEGPIAKARYETNCDVNRALVNFTVELQEVQTATLNFGDGSQAMFLGNTNPGAVVFTSTNHVYAASGDYTATVTAFNPGTGCANSTYTMLVTVRNVQANMVSSPTVCAGNPIQFNASASLDVLTGCSRGYIWFVDGLPPVETVTSSYTHTFTANGIHTVVMVVKDINSCIDTVRQTVRVSSVTPAFSLATNTICLSTGTLQLTNTSSQQPDSIVNYFWNFGNGSVLSTSSPAVPTLTYNTAQVPSSSYTINLLATNKLGCTFTVSQTLSVIKPQVQFLPSLYNFCVTENTATTVSFTPQFPYSTYTINYGASPSSTAVTSGVSSYTYNLPGTYTIETTISTAAGCENSGSFTINAVQTPTAEFIFSSPNSTGGNNICSGRVVSFTNVSAPLQYTPTWNLGSGILPNASNTVSLFYSAPSTSVIAISLTVNTGAPAFCSASTSDNFTIYVFNGDFIASDSIVCRGETLTFSITPDSKGLGAWLWSYGDATSSSTLMPPASSITSHVYSNYTATAAGYTSVSLIFWSGDMACKDGVDKLIKVVNIEPDFKRNNELLKIDSAHCINVVDSFSNLTTSNSSALTYTWSFGDGNATDTENPTHLYGAPGVYTVYLKARDKNRCEETTSKTMIIFPLPTATIIPKIEGYCPDVPFSLSMIGSAGVISGTWAPAANISGLVNFTTETAAYTTDAIAASTINYSVTVTNSNNCVSIPVDTVITIVQPPIPREWDTTVVIGEEIPINVVLQERFTYTWTPITKDLSCTSCLDPVSTSTVDVVYTLVMEDELRCKEVSSTYSVFILPKATVDLPTAFSPNGDGKNDIIYVDGWGIKKLNYLRIFNRWGQMLFESNDLSIGWDGTYNGIPQNVETYMYQVSVETYVDVEPLIKTASFKLIR